jgi:SAM-dependent methyltransferase
VPLAKGLAGIKAFARGILKDGVIWRLLQTANRRAKGGLRPVDRAKVGAQLVGGWQAPSIPAKQRALTAKELAEMYAGRIPLPFQVLADSIQAIGGARSAILEVGCSTGYHYEVLTHAFGHTVTYGGTDYSYAMIAEAKLRYPRLPLTVADATALPYDTGSVDIVISGCCLLHIPEYAKAIAESTRVAGRWVILHRTPVVAVPTQFYQKKAYGVPCVEIHFNEEELVELCAAQGLKLSRTWELGPSGDASHKTYVFEKTAR